MLWGPTIGEAAWSSMARWVADHAWAYKATGALILTFELTFPVALFRRSLQPWYAVVAVALHAATYLFLGLDYWAWGCTVLLLFVDWPELTERARRRWAAPCAGWGSSRGRLCSRGCVDRSAHGGPPVTKHIFVTGGVASSLGKGITASSLGRLLKSRGLRVTMQKLDPYINVDPGTMNPFEHGEVFVTDDGGETDLDLGHYERFIDENLTRDSNATTGSIYSAVLAAERRGRLPRQDGPGHPAHHRRDQAAHHAPGR